MSFSLAPAAPAQLAAIAALEAACFSLPRSAQQIARALPDFTAALAGEELLGYADFAAVVDEGYIGNVAVAPAHRRQGVGAALVAALLARGAALGLRFLTLEVRGGNRTARRLYEKCGFREMGTRKMVYEKPAEDAIIMTYFYEEG